ncbi:MAG: OsmC family protein [Melioribacteraceae bacterium]
MKVKIKRVDKKFHFQGFGISNIPVDIDGSEKIGGSNAGARPMELLLMGLGTCGAMDIVSILKKQKENLVDLNIEVTAERDEEKIPAVFKKINVIFHFIGELNKNKVEKAVNLSMGKYCSVSTMLEKTSQIDFSFTINGKEN